METGFIQFHGEQLQRASLAKTEQLIRQGCVSCGAEMLSAELPEKVMPRGILVVNNSGVGCDGSVMSIGDLLEKLDEMRGE